MRKIRTRTGRAGRYSLNARAFPHLKAAPVFAPLGARPPALPAAPKACSRCDHPISLVVLPQRLPQDACTAQEGCAILRDVLALRHRKAGGLAPLCGSDGRGLRPPLRNRRWGAYFCWGKNFLAAPPGHHLHLLGQETSDGAPAARQAM